MEQTPRRSVRVSAGADLGAAIAHLRRQLNLTQNELATRVGVHRSWVAQVETGRTSPLLDEELRVLRALGATVTVSWPATPTTPDS
jgi:transcriptional regulator with XRE-family HTH domain